ncbi:MAG TPA: circularly permuted type 2 ATP-grasp protein [Polyangia bacterium]|jgi:uncharacterized circularly permuted ATP-grasp superfamily protein/uncharacterized alpha-E superfamily protein|nr:circularly permuted type 2 ATP-grasp protein [Polyangia bacterium]
MPGPPSSTLANVLDFDSGLSRQYSPSRRSFDEMSDAHGAVRPHWTHLVERLEALGPIELRARWDQAQQLIHDNGVSFNVYGDAHGMERPWQLSPIPVVIAPDEFAAVAGGLEQRAHLLDRLLADVYGPQRCLAEGWLPPELVLAHPGFLRPCHGVQLPQGRFLHFYAGDLVRAPSGQFHVLTDRTQAPSGAGYALENRIIIARVFPDVFRDCNVQRLALFFRSMRQMLAALAPENRENPRIVLLSPGPYNATYFEQAFLAQYLGYMLVDGADLTVRDGRVFLKTLGGLHQVDVILRRLNDEFCDPLELRADSTLGIPGLTQAVRDGNVAVANALGSGILQMPALVPFLPAICRGLLGEELKMPSVPSWWCGDPAALSHVRANIDHLVIKQAYASPGNYGQTLFGEALSQAQRDELLARVAAAPARFVAQERIFPSTTPLMNGDQLIPRQMIIRSFLVARGDGSGYDVMPGALSLIAGGPDEHEISMQAGAGSKDTWVVSGGPVSTFSLLPPSSQPIALSRGGGDLPSRVADNLFWLGRYAERAEAIARLARTICLRLSEQTDPRLVEGSELTPLLVALYMQTHATLNPPPPSTTPPAPEERLFDAIFDGQHAGTLRATIRSTHRVAGVIRDRISADTWRVLTALDQEIREVDRGAGSYHVSGLARLLDRLVMNLAALSGMVMESMTRGQAWRFLDMGRRLERAINMVFLMRAALTTTIEREGPLLEAVLEVADSSITYRRRYLASLQVTPVIDMLLADETNPRSVAYQLSALATHMSHLPGQARAGAGGEERIVAGGIDRVRTADLMALGAADSHGQRPPLAALLEQMGRDLPRLSDVLSASYLSHAAVSRQLAEDASDGGPRR